VVVLKSARKGQTSQKAVRKLPDDAFKAIVRDKFLIQEGRGISHLRNTLCHMSDISDEEVNRIKQVMRDWFRVVAP